MPVVAKVLGFLAEHFELVEALIEAVDNGATKEELMRSIKATMVAASVERMKRELGG